MDTPVQSEASKVNDVVSVEKLGNVALIALNNPPVNAASQALRQGIHQAVSDLQKDPGIKAIGLYGEGRTFIAGADIREFGKPPQDPWLPDLCNFLENSETPIACIIHGTALGGGLEVAMSCHARIAVPSAKVGLPEVTLGILPGAGGTQRAPRLAGVASFLGHDYQWQADFGAKGAGVRAGRCGRRGRAT